jgi:glycosyltransferase involved in cell wall biosynthesis
MTRLSVLIPIYEKESPAFFSQSLASIAAQTRPANEVLIVKDGPLGPDLDAVIESFASKLPIETLQLELNRGLGTALRAGIEKCRFDLIARMDSDDICAPRRFEKQIGYLDQHPEIDVIGSSIAEFDSDPANCFSIRHLPEEHEQICAFAKLRNPLNHMSVVLRKHAVLAAGNYEHVPGFEDYDLWVRMILKGFRFHNLSEPLILVRCGSGMQSRRGGLAYARREIALFRSFRDRGFLTTSEFARNVVIRVPLRILPDSLRDGLYRDWLRRPVTVPNNKNPFQAG